MRADRLLSLLLTLQTEGKVKARELARRLEVSPRTIYRDLDALTAAGVPVYAEPGPTGGVALLGGYETQLTGLNRAELQTLFFGKPPALLQDLGMSRVADAALLKVLASLPAEQQGASRARQRLYIDTTGWATSRDAVPTLPLLYEAVGERRVTLRYARPDKNGGDKTVTRTVDPLGLVARGSTWYLIAAVEEQLRTYRVSRIEHAEVTDEACVTPEFDLAAYWEASKAAFREQLPRYPITVRADPRGLERIRSGRPVRAVTEAEAPDEHGWVKLTLLFEVDWEACEFLLSLGPAAVVLEPPELRKRVGRLALETAQLYAE